MSSCKRAGIILCGCNGNISGAIDLVRVADCLEECDGVEVETVDDLCDDTRFLKAKEIAKRVDCLVIAGCTDKECMARFRAVIEETKLPYFSCDFVNLKQECVGITSSAEIEKYALLAVRGCLEKLRAGLDLAEKAVPVMSSRDETLTRRQFFRLPLKFVRYEEIPVLNKERCIAGSSVCSACIDRCPTGAIVKDDTGMVHLQGEECQTCGLCSVVCPLDCFEMPTFSNAHAVAMLSALASSEVQLADRRLIFTCDRGRTRIDKLIDGGWKMPGSFVVRVPCLATISPMVLLRVMELGFDAAVLFCPQDRCGKQTALEKWEKVFGSLQELSTALTTPFRLKLVKNPGEDSTSSTVVEAFQEIGLACGKSRINKNAVPLDSSSAREGLVSVLGSLVKDEQSCLSINNLPLLFYSLQIDVEKCSMCGVCVRNCPSSALAMTEGEESTLQFSHYNCLGCGTCFEQCPENAITLTPTLDLPKLLGKTIEVKHRDDLARCQVCHRPIGKKSTLQNVERRLKEKGLNKALEMLYRCETCKALDAFE